jgi:chromosome partitioning protein
MRGLRRSRNKFSPDDGQDPEQEAQEPPVGTGSVTLIETSPPPVSEPTEPSPPVPPTVRVSETPVAPKSPPLPSGRTTPMKETISQVATAHAELDNVLPKTPVKRVPPPLRTDKPTPVTISAPVAGEIDAGPEPTPARPPEPKAEHAEPERDATAAPMTVEEEQAPVAVADRPPDDDALSRATDDSDPVEEVPVADSVAQAGSGNPLPRVMAVANQKGGVGKTTTSVNLGAALAELGFRVLVIDLDPQGNATTGLGIDARNFELSMYDVMMRDASLEDCVEPTSMKNLFVAPATIALAGAEIELVPAFSRELKLKRSIEAVLDDFDYVLIDCPPSLGLITVNALAAAHEVLVPIQCEYYALEGLSQLMRNVHLVASNLNPQLDISTIVLTMYDARTKLADQVANEVREHFGTKVCRSVIPRTVRLSEAPSFGQPITAFDPASRGAIAYRELAKEVSGGTS